MGKEIKPEKKIEEDKEKSIVDFSEWMKLDLVVGEIENVEEIPGADKLYKLTIDIGKEVRTICAGIKQFYSKDELKGKKVIVIANLAPRVMRGIESKGMLLAAEEGSKVSLLTIEDNLKPGSKVH